MRSTEPIVDIHLSLLRQLCLIFTYLHRKIKNDRYNNDNNPSVYFPHSHILLR